MDVESTILCATIGFAGGAAANRQIMVCLQLETQGVGLDLGLHAHGLIYSPSTMCQRAGF